MERTIRSIDINADDTKAAANAIEEMYEDRLDVVLVRGAFDPADFRTAGAQLDQSDRNPGWARPNQRMPVEDIQLLGTDTPATPTYQAPTGASLDDYLESASRHRALTDGVFAAAFDPVDEWGRVLGKFSGGRPARPAVAPDGRQYVPFTIRRLSDGRQIGIHHDYHYQLPLYADLSARLDTRTLISFVATLQQPDAGGELFVYGVTPKTPGAPKLPNGFQWDLEAIEHRYHFERFVPDAGDIFLLASGRCLHRVGAVAGPRARVTMGGFLALDQQKERIWFWS